VVDQARHRRYGHGQRRHPYRDPGRVQQRVQDSGADAEVGLPDLAEQVLVARAVHRHPVPAEAGEVEVERLRPERLPHADGDRDHSEDGEQGAYPLVVRSAP
jgi:hypothetical protein